MGTNPPPAGFPPASPNRPNVPPPAPPPPEITIRTMQSDLTALKQTGGSGPAPKPFTPPELTRDFSRPAVPPPPPPSPTAPKITPSDFTAPKPPSAISPSGPVAKTPVIEEEKGGRDWKKMTIWGGVLVLIIGAGVAGYLFVYPILFPKVPPPPAPAITVPPVVETPAETPVSVTPATPKPHFSLLAISDSVSPVLLVSADLTSLKLALLPEGQKTMPAGSLAEVTINDAGGQAASSIVLPLLLPELTADSVKNLLEDDFTAAIFHDANGAWPVYIFKLSAESSIVEGQAVTGSLETSPNLANLFLNNPGTPNPDGFKTGPVNGIPARYLTFEKTGASLNFAWTGDKLIISSSYGGLKKVLSNLAQ